MVICGAFRAPACLLCIGLSIGVVHGLVANTLKDIVGKPRPRQHTIPAVRCPRQEPDDTRLPMLSIVKDPDRLERAKRRVYHQLSAAKLHPVIARTFPLTNIVEAHRSMESNEQIGKIVVTV